MSSPSGPAPQTPAQPQRSSLGMPSSGMVRPGSIRMGRPAPVGEAPEGPGSTPVEPIPGHVGDGYDEDQDAFAGTFYHQVGGRETFRRLVEKFYEGVAADPEFRAMYPEEDLRPAQMRLQLFLEQYWGGPTTYSDHRGHPRLRMRHLPYAVDSAARETWLRHMRAALDSLDLPQLAHDTMWDYFERAAHSMQNTAG